MTFSLKFFPVKDFIFSIVPTVASFEGYIQDLLPLPMLSNKYVEIALGLAISLLLALIFHKGNVRNYKKSLAEILATGYVSNFAGRLSKLLKGKAPIEFSFPDQSVHKVMPENVRVEVGLPKSLSSLNKFAQQVEKDTEIVYIREATLVEPYWVRAKKENDGSLTIIEFPRTLFALPKYLKKDFPDLETSEKKSKRIFKYFNQKIEELRIDYSQEIPQASFVFNKV